ncbi:hypothetical protein MPLA_730048 [Mesorhizobium sp. ORS 3359]|nr:hypothetical protein MPLA_730048 [Mesorhizobium sp. ORS 3359]
MPLGHRRRRPQAQTVRVDRARSESRRPRRHQAVRLPRDTRRSAGCPRPGVGRRRLDVSRPQMAGGHDRDRRRAGLRHTGDGNSRAIRSDVSRPGRAFDTHRVGVAGHRHRRRLPELIRLVQFCAGKRACRGSQGIFRRRRHCLDRHIRAGRTLPAAGAASTEAPGLTGGIARRCPATAGAFHGDVSPEKNFAPLAPFARLDSGKAPAYLSATLALAFGEC